MLAYSGQVIVKYVLDLAIFNPLNRNNDLQMELDYRRDHQLAYSGQVIVKYS